MFHRINAHPPVTGMGRRMKIAIIDERIQLHLDRCASLQQRVLHVRGVRALLHPNALLQPSVAGRVSPNGSGAIQTKSVDILKSLGLDRAARPKMRRQRKFRNAASHNLIETGHQMHPPNWRLQRRD